jgi:PAS domain S-box-containing protein
VKPGSGDQETRVHLPAEADGDAVAGPAAAARTAGERALLAAVARSIAVGVVYFGVAKAGLALASIHPSATPIWPAAGLALAAVLLWGRAVAPAIFVGALLANALTAGSLATSAAIALGNTLEAVITAVLLRRWAGGTAAFETALGVAKFALLCLGPGTFVSATIGVVSLSLGGYAAWGSFASIWMTWWLGDVAGALVVAPAVVLWARASPLAPAGGRAETALLYVAALGVGLVALSPVLEQTTHRGALAFLAILPLLWAALRRGPRETAAIALILSAFAVWGTVLEGGPFARATLNDSFLLLLAFMISACVPSLALSADLDARRSESARLHRGHAELEGSVRERTDALLEANAALRTALAKHRRTESELRQQRLHLLEAQRLARLGSWVWDVAENRVDWSDGLYEIFGLAPDEFGGTFEDFLGRVHPDDRARVRDTIERVFREGGEFRVEERILRPDGAVRHLLGTGRALAGEDGRTQRLLGICQDVTQTLEAQKALDETRQALHQAQKMEALGQLTGGIAHDFNNILTAIINSLELVRAAPGTGGAGAPRLDRALKAARNGAALVQQLLVFARKQPAQAEPADINAIVRATLTMLSRSASENIAVVAELAADLKWARVDPTQLQTAILNLAVNARDAMPAGGILTMSTANVPPESAPAGPHRAGGWVSITVSDTGVGMTPEVRARAFEPFFTTKELGKGTGLGLSMVYSAMRQVGGDVSIASEPGKGTSVRLLLPAIDPPAAARGDAAAPPLAAAPAPGTTLLYVEDEALVRLATVDLLESAGYTVLHAADAERGLALLERHSEVRVLVTDIGLPGMNGHALAAAARRARPGLKVVFLTGYDRNRAGLPAGTGAQPRDAATRYLDKPYLQDDLFRALAELAALP